MLNSLSAQFQGCLSVNIAGVAVSGCPHGQNGQNSPNGPNGEVKWRLQ